MTGENGSMDVQGNRELPAGWRLVNLGEVASLINGRAYSADELLKDGKYPVLRVGNLFTSDHWYYSDLELDAEKYCNKGDLLYAWSASFGCFIWKGPISIFHYHIWKLVCKDNLYPEYAQHALNLITETIKSKSHGLGMLHMTKNGMEQFKIPLPPLPEQQRIAALLNEQMAAVEKARSAAQERLESIKALPAAFLRQVFPDADQPLPEGWRWVKLGELFDITSSKRVFESDWQTEGVPFYRAREIVKLSQQGFVDNDLFIAEEMFSEYSTRYGIPKAGDIMVTGVGTLGICYVVRNGDRFYFKDGNIIWLKKNSDTESAFIEYAFRSEVLRQQIDDSSGATVGTYTIIKAKNTRVPVPSIQDQKKIIAALDEQMATIEKARKAAEAELETINALPAALLRRAFNGEL